MKIPDIEIPAAARDSAAPRAAARRAGKLRSGAKKPGGGQGGYVNLSKVKAFVIYFYPKDATPGCAAQGREFSRLYKSFQAIGFEVFGVSQDSISSHEKFRASEKFPFPLLSDSEGKLCQAFQTLKEKTNFGKRYIGIERSAFAVQDGKILKALRNVKATGHPEEILEWLRQHAADSGKKPR